MTEKAKTLAQKITRRIRRNPYREVSEITPLFIRAKLPNGYAATISEPSMKICDSDECATNPWTRSANSNPLLFLLRWPITFLLWCTVPDSRRFKRCYILTFINCVVWIGGISYFVVFLTTDVGERDFSDSICFGNDTKNRSRHCHGLDFSRGRNIGSRSRFIRHHHRTRTWLDGH